MSSVSSCEDSGPRRRSHSTPHKSSAKELGEGTNPRSSAVSTYSLLSPIYNDSFISDKDDPALDPEDLTEQIKNVDFRTDDPQDKARQSETGETLGQDLNLTPWQEWLLSKEKQLRVELEKKVSEDLKHEEERLKLQHKKEMKKVLAEEEHKEWVRKKQEQERQEKEQKLLKEQQERELQALRKSAIQEKSKEKYHEWLKKKKEDQQERRRKEKEGEEKRLEEQNEKKEKAKKVFEEWLEDAKTRPRPTLHSYGYTNGKLTGYYDGSSYPAPGFYNPIPWKPIHVPPPPKEAAKNLSRKKTKKAGSSQSYRSNLGPLYKPKDNLQIGKGTFKR
uniref:Coiled-coil domain containing 34 n=1 Tax=Leptobrachium leishanense TaxID=445787 RepID=A0A8C5QBJ5_9ANUR